MVSVVMTTYNGEKYIKEQLFSLANQTKKADEVLIFDDGSKDSTADIVKDFIQKNSLVGWHFYTNEINKGWKKNFVDGVSKASGDYIFFSDQDDIWFDYKIEVMINAMCENTNINVLAGRYVEFNDKTPTKVKAGNGSVHKAEKTVRLITADYPGCVMCVRGSFWNKYVDYWNETYSHDGFVWSIAKLFDSAFLIEMPVIYWRRHSDSTYSVFSDDIKSYNHRCKKLEDSRNNIMTLLEIARKFNADKDKSEELERYKNFILLRYKMIEKQNPLVGIRLIRYVHYYGHIKPFLRELYLSLPLMNSKEAKKMDDDFGIGLMGCLTSHRNLGCVALTYSLLYILERTEASRKHNFVYYIFENQSSPEKVASLCRALNIPANRIKIVPNGFHSSYKTRIRHMKENIGMLKALDKCEVIIDMTQGDSFTDIYGQSRFNDYTNTKVIVEKKNIPLILGPQTYGPFVDERNRKQAGSVISKAMLVLSRDEKSVEYVSDFCDSRIETVTDVAFFLPYQKNEKKSKKIRVGINISGLLIRNKNDSSTLSTDIKVDYDKLMEKVLYFLESDESYEIHLIPHVGHDGIREYSSRNKKIIVHEPFNSPIDAKNYISGMDIFIGSRMHATIAAFSSGVATIPLAYSRKFAGLYEALGYHHTVDMSYLSTNDAYDIIIEDIKNWRELQKEVNALQGNIDKKKSLLSDLLDESIFSIIEKRRA